MEDELTILVRIEAFIDMTKLFLEALPSTLHEFVVSVFEIIIILVISHPIDVIPKFRDEWVAVSLMTAGRSIGHIGVYRVSQNISEFDHVCSQNKRARRSRQKSQHYRNVMTSDM